MSAEHHPHRRLVASLFGTIKLVQMYGRDHDATEEAARNLYEAVRIAVGDAEEVVISVRGSRLQIQERTMRASECGNLALSYLVHELRRRDIAAIHIRTEASPHEIATFTECFIDAARDPGGATEALVTSMLSHGINHIAIERCEEPDEDPMLQEERRDATMRAYVHGLRAFKEVLRSDGYPDRAKVRRARRAVQGLVDGFLEDEAAVLTLARIHGHDIKLFHHCMSVSLYAIAIGQRIGMTRRQLGELGLAALFHDLGKTAAENEADTPSLGARMLLAESANHEGMLKAAITAYEHRAHYDRSGNPQLEHEPHLFSRIIAIADFFEAVTSQRTPAEPARSVYETFRLMQDRAGTVFDPILLKVFVNALGIYPVGSLVGLSTGEVAVVVASPSGQGRLDQPRVRVVDQGTGVLDKGADVDLAEINGLGVACRTITVTLQSDDVFGSIGDLVGSV